MKKRIKERHEQKVVDPDYDPVRSIGLEAVSRQKLDLIESYGKFQDKLGGYPELLSILNKFHSTVIGLANLVLEDREEIDLLRLRIEFTFLKDGLLDLYSQKALTRAEKMGIPYE